MYLRANQFTNDRLKIENTFVVTTLQPLTVRLARVHVASVWNQTMNVLDRVALRHEMGVVETDFEAGHILEHALAVVQRPHYGFAVGLRANFDASLARKVDHAAQLATRDRIDVFVGKTLIFVLDAGAERNAGTADGIAERRERLEHLEIIVACAFVRLRQRAFELMHKLVGVDVAEPNKAVVHLEFERFDNAASGIGSARRIFAHGRPVDVRPADRCVLEP